MSERSHAWKKVFALPPKGADGVRPKRHWDAETLLEDPELRAVWGERSPVMSHALLNALARPDLYEVDPVVRYTLEQRLQEDGYLPQVDAPASRAERLTRLRQQRLFHVQENDGRLERQLQRAGRGDACVTLGIIDVGFNVFSPQVRDRLLPDGQTPTGTLTYGQSLDDTASLWSDEVKDNQHGDHVVGIATRGSDRIRAHVRRLNFGATTVRPSAQMVRALDDFSARGVRIVSISLHLAQETPPSEISAVLDAIRRHPELTVVLSASNLKAQELGQTPGLDGSHYLASNVLENLIVVAGANLAGAFAEYSAFSPKYVTHAMFGGRIRSFGAGDHNWADDAGTSMATPNVTNTLARMLLFEETLTPIELKRMLTDASLPRPGWKERIQAPGPVDQRRAENLAQLVHCLRQGDAPSEAMKRLGLTPRERELIPLALQYVHAR